MWSNIFLCMKLNSFIHRVWRICINQFMNFIQYFLITFITFIDSNKRNFVQFWSISSTGFNINLLIPISCIYETFTSTLEIQNQSYYAAMLSKVLHKMSFISPFLGRLSHSGDLFPWVGICRQASSINFFFSRTNGPILTKIGISSVW